MNATWRWSFSNGWFWAGVVVFCLLLFTTFWSLQRRGWTGPLSFLEACRLVLAILIVLALAKPETWQSVTPDDPTPFLILHDRSASMDTEDMTLPDGNRGSRGAWIDAQTSWRDALPDHLTVISRDIETAESGQTNLSAALIKAGRHSDRRLGGVVLFSDGDWTSGPPPEEAALALRRQGLSVWTVPVGLESPLPDIVVSWLPMPRTLLVDEPTRLPFEVENRFSRPIELTLTFQPDGLPEAREERHLQLQAGETLRDTFFWRPERERDVSLNLSTTLIPGENSEDNNADQAAVTVRQDHLQVLLVDSAPRWEFRYLRNALMRDPGVEVACVLYHPHPELGTGKGPGYLDAFPGDMQSLTNYDAVFLGDIGVDQGHLTLSQAEQLRGLVERQASGLIFLPGRLGHQQSLQDSPLAELIPVSLDTTAPPSGFELAAPATMELTAAGRGNVLLTLGQDEAETTAVWRSLPGFFWHAPVSRAKPGATVLAVHESSRNAYGRLPLLVTRPIGSGKVLYLATAGAWRWRRGVEDLYHYRFWSQVARWMAYQRNLAKSERGRLIHYPEAPQAGREVILDATLLDSQRGPLTDAQPTLTWRLETDPKSEPASDSNGKDSGTVSLNETPGGWGVYRGSWVPPRRGSYQLAIQWVGDPSLRLNSTLVVSASEREVTGDPARHDVMRRIANAGGGQTVSADSLNSLATLLSAQVGDDPVIHRHEWWRHPGLLALLIAGLTIYWTARKRLGLV